MLVVVKKHPIEFRVEGNIPCTLIDSLKLEYGDAMSIENDGNLMPVEEMVWYKNLQGEDFTARCKISRKSSLPRNLV